MFFFGEFDSPHDYMKLLLKVREYRVGNQRV